MPERSTSSLLSLLGRLQQLEQAATPAPWFSDYGKIGAGENGIGEMDNPEDGALVAAARNLFGPLVAVAVTAEVLSNTAVFQMPNGFYVAEDDIDALRAALSALAAAGETT